MTAPHANHALLLNADYTALMVISWERAITLIMDGTAERVEHYQNKLVRSVSTAVPWPAVVRLFQYVRKPSRMRFNRQNVLARDSYTCAYCGAKPRQKDGRPDFTELTLDHVVPRAQSKDARVFSPYHNRTLSITCWENVVTACSRDNERKADRTPEQAGMRLLWIPRQPTQADVLRMSLKKVAIPEEWKSYLPEGSKQWGGYWTDELDPD
jgi:5-methylcytosine-specific restriction endonuclease McrA